jgi:predicted Fe-Mo cluster-binding NifX family protein
MTIAIPIYENRVMPRFGFTREIIVVTVEDEKVVSNRRLTISQEELLSLPAMLASEQVSVLICGGIHPRFQQAIQQQRIELIWGVIGDWQEVVSAYLDGTLQSNPAFCLCHGRGKGTRLRAGHRRRGI